MGTMKTRKGILNQEVAARCSPAMLNLITKAGGIYALAQRVGIWYSKLYYWLAGDHPPEPNSPGYRKLSRLLLKEAGVTLEEALGLGPEPQIGDEQFDWMPEEALSYRIDEDAMIARLDVEIAIKRLATKQPKRAEAVRRYHGIGEAEEDYTAIGARMALTPQRVRQLEIDGRQRIARKLRSYDTKGVTHGSNKKAVPRLRQREPVPAGG